MAYHWRVQPPLGSKRAVILSGMSAAEVMGVIGAYRDAGLPETVWAAAVPANFDRKVAALVDDIYGDHAYMVSCSCLCQMKCHCPGIHGSLLRRKCMVRQRELRVCRESLRERVKRTVAGLHSYPTFCMCLKGTGRHWYHTLYFETTNLSAHSGSLIGKGGCPLLPLILLWSLEVRVAVSPPGEAVAVQAEQLALPLLFASAPGLQGSTYLESFMRAAIQ